MKIGIATCAEKSNLTFGDRQLATVLENKGAQVEALIWNDPGVLSRGWDVILIRSTWDYHQYPTEFLEWLSQVERSSIPLINSADVVRWNFDKSYLLEVEKRGLSIVPTLLIKRENSVSQALEKIERAGWAHFVLKPSVSATAFLTSRQSLASLELPRAIGQIHMHSDLIVQPFVSSISSSGEVSLVFFNDESPQYSHSVLKKPQSNDFRVQSDFGGTVQAYRPSDRLLSFAKQCVDAIKGDWLFARVDLVDWEQKPLLSEIELIEPDLFVDLLPNAVQNFADAIAKRLRL